MQAANTQSIFDLIVSAGVESKVVLALCAIFSIASWYLIASKWWEFRGYRRRRREFERATSRARGLDERVAACVHLTPSPFTSLTHAASQYMADLRLAMQRDNVTRSGLSLTQLEALIMTLDAEVRRSAETAGSGLAWLATIGSSAPLLGLFGTVLGIIKSFNGIGSGNSTMASVGPGIAEALIATAAGLLAAIPAVMAYNLFTARTERLEGVLERLAQETIGTLGREGKL